MLSTLWYGFFRLHSPFCIRGTISKKKKKKSAKKCYSSSKKEKDSNLAKKKKKESLSPKCSRWN